MLPEAISFSAALRAHSFWTSNCQSLGVIVGFPVQLCWEGDCHTRWRSLMSLLQIFLTNMAGSGISQERLRGETNTFMVDRDIWWTRLDPNERIENSAELYGECCLGCLLRFPACFPTSFLLVHQGLPSIFHAPAQVPDPCLQAGNFGSINNNTVALAVISCKMVHRHVYVPYRYITYLYIHFI